jgi:hypothetical protein
MSHRNSLVCLRRVAAGLALLGLLGACSNESGAGKGSGCVEFTVGSETVSSRVWSFHRFTRNGDYNFTSSMHADKRTLNLNFRNPAAGKSLSFGAISSGNYGTYSAVFGDPTTIWNITSGNMRFTEFDIAKKKVSASFEFTVQAADNRSMKIVGTIADGDIGVDQLLE